MSIERYFAIVKSWEKEYGVKSRAFNYDITEARLCCEKCGKLKPKMSRHHTGNDFFFAEMMPQHFAARYIQFRKEDTSKLCDKCHKNAHRVYKPLLDEMWAELHLYGQKIITKTWCEDWMQKFRDRFATWIKRPVRKKRRKRKSHSATKHEVNDGRTKGKARLRGLFG